MINEEDEVPEWESQEENPPENLKRKWIEREYFGKETVQCPACQKKVPADNLICLFCGAAIDFDTGVLGKILKWIKGFFR